MDRFLRRTEVEQIVGLGRSSIYERMRRGEFPRPVRLSGSRAVRWQQSEVKAWMNAQPQQGDDGPRKNTAGTMGGQVAGRRRRSASGNGHPETAKSDESGTDRSRRPPIRVDSDTQSADENPKAEKKR